MGKKVEIIEIDLDIDIDEEIRKKVNSLKTDIVIHTKDLINRTKLRKTSKKSKQAQERNLKLAKAVEHLETIFDHCGSDSWVEGKKLLDVAGIEQTPQNLNKFSLQVRKYLTKADKWVLLRKRKSGKTVYRLERFS